MLAATILENEMKSIGPEHRELVGQLLDDRGDSTERRDDMVDYLIEQRRETKLSAQRAETWLRSWDDTAETLSAPSDPQWDKIAAVAKQIFMSERTTRFKDTTGLERPQDMNLSEKLSTRIQQMKDLRKKEQHRPHLVPPPFPAMASRMVSRAELKINPKAQEALRK